MQSIYFYFWRKVRIIEGFMLQYDVEKSASICANWA